MASKDGRGALQKAEERLAAITSSFIPFWTTSSPAFPKFDDLPRVRGTINLLTPDVVKQASTEIRTGRHVQLDWPLNQEFPGFGRRPLEQKVIDLGGAALDDELHFNTQSSSQLDGLKHFAHQQTKLYYNDLSHEDALHDITNGIHNWCERGGIVGRGVLVDWVRWYEQTQQKRPPLPTTRHQIPISEIEEALRFQGTSTRVGDILLVRTGYVRWNNEASPEARKEYSQRTRAECIGVEANEKTVRWLYDRHFAAVAGDNMSFEAWPPPWKSGWCLHEWLLVGWGTCIGELWDLEVLSKICDQENRWTFFFTSAPLYVKGGVGSPPCAIAVF